MSNYHLPYRYNRHFLEPIGRFFANERLVSGLAHALIIGGATLAILEMKPDGVPSTEQNQAVQACGDKLGPIVLSVPEYKIPPACDEFAGDFARDTGQNHNTNSDDIVNLPTATAFLAENTVGDEYDTKIARENYIGAGMLGGAGLALLGGVAFRRRLEEVDFQQEVANLLAKE